MIARADKITAVTAPIVETDLNDRFRAARMSASVENGHPSITPSAQLSKLHLWLCREMSSSGVSRQLF